MPIPPVPVTPVNHIKSIDDKLDTIILGLVGMGPDLAAIEVDVAAIAVDTALLSLAAAALVGQTAPYETQDRLVLPNIGTAAIPAVIPALPAPLVGGICRGVVSNSEGSMLAGLMPGSVEVCSDYDMAGDGSLWTPGAGWAWSGANHRFDAGAGTATSLRFTANCLKDGWPYLVVVRVNRTAGQIRIECGSGALSVALAAAGLNIFACVLTCTTSLKIGVLATGFEGYVDYLRPVRICHYMGAGVEYPDRFSMIAACVSGDANAGAQVHAMY